MNSNNVRNTNRYRIVHRFLNSTRRRSIKTIKYQTILATSSMNVIISNRKAKAT